MCPVASVFLNECLAIFPTPLSYLPFVAIFFFLLLLLFIFFTGRMKSFYLGLGSREFSV